MKLLLTSAGITNKSIAKALLDLAGLPAEKIRVAFIPTAANVEEGDKSWIINDYVNLTKQTYGCVDIVDISAIPQKVWLPRLTAANALILGGGNTFWLMHWIRKSGLDKILPGLLEERIYVGISAGSMVASKNIFLTSDKPVFDENRFGQTDIAGLGLINFYVRPHFNSQFFPKAKAEYIKQAAEQIPETIYAIDDQTAIKIDGDKNEIVSEGEYLIFNKK
jgi:dipeptidase E